MLRILYLEPFDGGSHRAFTQVLTQGVSADWTRLTLPGRHWKWRMRGAVPYWVLEHQDVLCQPYDLIFASSYVPLAELIGLAPQLAAVPRLLYFHENQLTYPAQVGQQRERDNHFGVTQLVSALAAQTLVFNSDFNRRSFFEAGEQLLARLPDRVPKGWIPKLRSRSRVLGVPLDLPALSPEPFSAQREGAPLILWNHRWEHDKAPEVFAQALLRLADEGLSFDVALCGQRFGLVPSGFEALRTRLGPRVRTFGEARSRAEYEGWLSRADIAVSTARHEFFGIAMLEAAHFGARPLVPDALAYPELFEPCYRYPVGALEAALTALLKPSAEQPPLRADRQHITRGLGAPLLQQYAELFDEMANAQPAT